MKVSVAFARHSTQVWITINAPDGATVEEVIALSGLLQQFPEIDLGVNKVGIFGTILKLSTPVTEGDRVEIYRPIHPEAEFLDRRS